MLMVVRQADAGDKRAWEGPDVLRPLSPTGHRQAEGLVIRLEDYPVDRILCSPTLRCRQTVEPLAGDRLLPIEPVPALGADTGPARLLAVFWDLELRNTVLCPHGEGDRPAAYAPPGGRAGGRGPAGLAQGLHLAARAHRPAAGTGPLPGSASVLGGTDP